MPVRGYVGYVCRYVSKASKVLQSIVAVTLEAHVSSSRKLLTDRTWSSQVAQVSHRLPDASFACAAVSDPLLPGITVEGYELVERSGLLGVCKHEQTSQTTEKMEIVQWSTRHSPLSPVCPLPGAASASNQEYSVPPLAPPPPRTDIEQAKSPEGPVLEYQYAMEEAERIYVNAHYRLKKRFDAGSHGEVWRATRRHSSGREEQFVLKRLFLELGKSMTQMGLREAHFGTVLKDERHVARFVEYFFRSANVVESKEAPRTTPELWLVFYDEGKSLRQYLYERVEVVNRCEDRDGGAGVILQPSRFWEKLRTDVRGENVLKEIMRQLLQAVATLHARGITHRDIKPSNILVSISSLLASTAPTIPIVKLADFGSAVDDYTLQNLYARDGDNEASAGPSQAEETREYQPPEVLFSDNGQPYDYTAPEAYDLWSVGVVFLEMVLGSPQVFLISSRERAKLDVVLDTQRRKIRLKHGSDEDPEFGWRTKAYLLHVLTQEFCIFHPAPRQLRSLWDKYALVSESCHFGRFNQTVVERDPLKHGLEDPWGLDLMWRLLQWNPSERITAEEALQHAYFQGAFSCKESGRQFATRRELLQHERYLKAQRVRESVFASIVRTKYELPDRFKCPHCGRAFATAQSCEQHVRARRHNFHSHFCEFEAPHIASAIRMESQPFDVHPQPEQSAIGIALFQGRKKYMEDFVLTLSEQQLKEKWSTEENTKALGFDLYAVVDGHLGSAAATFVVENLPRILCHHFNTITKSKEDSTEAKAPNEDINVSSQRELAEKFALRQTFLELHESFLQSLDHVPHVDNLELKTNTSAQIGEYFSGCTLTVVLHFRQQQRLVSANVGDSHALAWLPRIGQLNFAAEIISLSRDHWPNDPGERSRIESSGGFVSFSGLWRVVGQLAVSRSLGDRHLRNFVIAEPSIFHTQLGPPSGGLVVIASDGVWETMSNSDVVRFLEERWCSKGAGEAYNDVAASLNNLATELLTESYIRGSLDNMAAVLVALP